MPFAAIDARAERGEPLPSLALPASLTVESSNRWRRYSSPNVIGMVRGADPGLARELVLVTSHLDHLGIDPAEKGPDKIFNGARDNASGIAAMIEAARQFAGRSQRPRRSVAFAAVTAEEVGLLGSDYLAAHPVFGDARIVAVVNIDGGVPLLDTTAVRAVGGWHSTLGATVETVASRNGFGTEPELHPQGRVFPAHRSFQLREARDTGDLPGSLRQQRRHSAPP